MSTAPLAPAETFALIVQALRGVIAARMSRPKTAKQQAAFPLLMLLWHRLGRMINRFTALAARAAAGPLPASPLRPERPDRPSRPPELLPRGTAWLIRLLGWEAAGYGSQLHHFLSQPEMAAFLETAPQAGRIFRPLCRMLGQPEPPRRKPASPTVQATPPPEAAATSNPAPPTGTQGASDGPPPSAESTRAPEGLFHAQA